MHGENVARTRPSTDELKQLVDTRLHQLAEARPDLVRAVDLQRALLEREIDLLEVIASGGLPGLSLPAGYLAAKLRRGIPALHGEPVPLPARLLKLSAREFCERLAEGGVGEPAANVGRALDTRTLDGDMLLSACFGRDQRRVRVLAVQQNLSPDIAWMVAELALAPFAYLLQSQALTRVTDAPTGPVPSAMASWDRGFCPACGSWPALAESGAGGHQLRCSFCAARWTLASYRCVYCANRSRTFVTAAPDLQVPGRRLQLCGGCGGYMKVLDVPAPAQFPLIAVEDLASMDLDLIALERKYLRPPMAEIKKV
jgi:FdhE protein